MPPTGQYTKVYVFPAGHAQGQLTNGAGTQAANGTFTCGDWSHNPPRVDDRYRVTATNPATNRQYEFFVRCTHAGSPNSDFVAAP